MGECAQDICKCCTTGRLKLEHQRVWVLRSGPMPPLPSKQNNKNNNNKPTITKSHLKRKTFISSYTSRKWSINREVIAGTWRQEVKQSHRGVPFTGLLSMACSATSLGWHGPCELGPLRSLFHQANAPQACPQASLAGTFFFN